MSNTVLAPTDIVLSSGRNMFSLACPGNSNKVAESGAEELCVGLEDSSNRLLEDDLGVVSHNLEAIHSLTLPEPQGAWLCKAMRYENWEASFPDTVADLDTH